MKQWETIAYFAYDAFERQGRGVVAVERDESGTASLFYGPADFFQREGQTDPVRLLELYDPATEFLVHFQDTPAGTRTLRVRTPVGGQNPKGIWFFRMLGLVVEQPDALPDYLPKWFFRALKDLERAKREKA
ncbi:MAG: hypothetical protein ABIR38_00435 [Chthoniobacterales bacterium]